MSDTYVQLDETRVQTLVKLLLDTVEKQNREIKNHNDTWSEQYDKMNKLRRELAEMTTKFNESDLQLIEMMTENVNLKSLYIMEQQLRQAHSTKIDELREKNELLTSTNNDRDDTIQDRDDTIAGKEAQIRILCEYIKLNIIEVDWSQDVNDLINVYLDNVETVFVPAATTGISLADDNR